MGKTFKNYSCVKHLKRLKADWIFHWWLPTKCMYFVSIENPRWWADSKHILI